MTRLNPFIGIVFAGAALAATTPLMAQGAPEEIIVTGHFGRAPDNVRSLSRHVSYADLDLSTSAGKDELRHRVSLTARYLCNQLGEQDGPSTSPVPTCRDDATRNAMDRVGTLEAHFAPRGTTWARGPAWAAPYPSDWTTRYP